MENKEISLDAYEVLEKLPIGIFILRLESRETKEFRNIFVNDTDSKIVGTDLKPFMGKTLRESFPDAYDHGLPDKYLEALDTQKTVKIGQMQYGDDKVKAQTFFLKVVPLDDRTVMLTTENISKLQLAQEQLSKKNESLEIKNEELQHLAYIVSHDLKSPVNTISGLIDLLEGSVKEQLKGKDAEAFRFIRSSCDRMKSTIETILEYSLIGTKKEVEQFDCNVLLEEIRDDLGGVIKEKDAMLEAHGLPVLKGYKTEARQLFQNLIANALKFHKPEVSPHVRVSAEQENGQWHFRVSDNGIGIAKADYKKIFAVFHRLHDKKAYEGSGIGLANCKKIVELHRGKIWVESAPGEGSTFHFTLADTE